MKRYLERINSKIKLLLEFQVRPLLKTRGKLCAHKNATVELQKGAKIDIGGRLEFNAKWTKKDPFPSILALRVASSLVVRGNFSIYSGSRVYVNQGATLILGSGYINNNLSLSCFEKIEIGNGVAISENVCIRDSRSEEHTSELQSLMRISYAVFCLKKK